MGRRTRFLSAAVVRTTASMLIVLVTITVSVALLLVLVLDLPELIKLHKLFLVLLGYRSQICGTMAVWCWALRHCDAAEEIRN